jgi:L-asparagine transporter-like permease
MKSTQNIFASCVVLVIICLIIVGIQAVLGDPNKSYYGDYSQQP